MPHTIRNEALHHAADDPPYEGRELQAWPGMTLLRGEVVWNGERFVGRADAGRLPRCKRPEGLRPRPRAQNWRRWMELGD